MENPLASLQALSQALSQTDDSEAVFTIIQQAIAREMGDQVGVVVAYYDAENAQIQFPYVWVDGQRRQLPTYELQDDTLSQVIQSGKPILLSQMTDGPLSVGKGHLGTSSFSKERLANIRFTSRTAYSLMVAPFLARGQAFGAIAAMDYLEAGRFTEDDLSYLTVIAGQVAGREQAMRLLAYSNQQAYHERMLYEATTKIRGSVDMNTILETTVHELGRILDASRVHIELQLPKFMASDGDGFEANSERQSTE